MGWLKATGITSVLGKHCTRHCMTRLNYCIYVHQSFNSVEHRSKDLLIQGSRFRNITLRNKADENSFRISGYEKSKRSFSRWSRPLYSFPDSSFLDYDNWSYSEDTVPETWTSPVSATNGRLLIVDGSALLYRSYYKVQSRMKQGYLCENEANEECPIVVLSALSSVIQLLTLLPTHAVICFDAKGMNFRHELYSGYKQQRPPPPDAVVASLPLLRSALLAMGLHVVQEFGVEADDVIASIASCADACHMEVVIASPDKDFFQLLSDRVAMLRPRPRGSQLYCYRVPDYQLKYGFTLPSQFVDILALMGDKVDNVPGVFGIGEKWACKLVKQFGSVEELCANLHQVQPDRLRKLLEAGKENAVLSKRLVKLQTNLPRHVLEGSESWSKLAFTQPSGDSAGQLWSLLEAFNGDSHGARLVRRRIELLWELLESRQAETRKP